MVLWFYHTCIINSRIIYEYCETNTIIVGKFKEQLIPSIKQLHKFHLFKSYITEMINKKKQATFEFQQFMV